MCDAIQEIRARHLGLLELAADRVVPQAKELDFGVVGVETLERVRVSKVLPIVYCDPRMTGQSVMELQACRCCQPPASTKDVDAGDL